MSEPSLNPLPDLECESDPTVLRGENLQLIYGHGRAAVAALRDVSIEVRRGELLVIMGRSGCGKSTLLHVLGGLLTPTAGSISIAGEELGVCGDARRTELRRRHVGFVFQRFNLLPTLSADDNLRVAQWVGSGRLADSAQRRQRRQELLTSLGLDGKQHHRPGELSGGEQQRVAIARAMVNAPSILLADEPTGNLDSLNARSVLAVLEQLNRERRQTIVMITHDDAVARHATRVVQMRDGRLHG